MSPAKRKAARKKTSSRKKTTASGSSGKGKGASKSKKKGWCTQDLDFRSSDDALWITNHKLREQVDIRYRAGTLRIGYNDPNSPSYEVNVKC